MMTATAPETTVPTVLPTVAMTAALHFGHSFVLSSVGRLFALDDADVADVQEWVAEYPTVTFEPIGPGEVRFQAGGVLRVGDDAAAVYVKMRWYHLISAHRDHGDDEAL